MSGIDRDIWLKALEEIEYEPDRPRDPSIRTGEELADLWHVSKTSMHRRLKLLRKAGRVENVTIRIQRKTVLAYKLLEAGKKTHGSAELSS